MKTAHLSIASVLVTLCVTAPLQSDEPRLADIRGEARIQADEDNLTTEQKRDVLREVLRRQLTNVRNFREADAKLDRMSAEQIDALFDVYLIQRQELEQQRLLQAQAELARAKAYRDYLAAQLYQQRMQAARGGVGFAPVITWLPEGAHLQAGAVVSPDRRHIRITASPFFSSIPAVHAFNFHKGKTTQIYPDPAQRPRVRAERTWDDGRR